MSGVVKISSWPLIRKRRDGQIEGGGSSGSIVVNNSNATPGGGVAAVLDDLFEVVNPGTEDAYIRCKLPFAGDYEIQAWTDLMIVQNSHAFQTPAFANPFELDATLFKDFKCGLITGNTTINLNNTTDGDAGMIEIIIDGTGGYTVALGTMFTKKLGPGILSTLANADNDISWRNVAGDIHYTIAQIES
jgi:hypothetical protein